MMTEDYIVLAGLVCGFIGVSMLVYGFRKAGWL